MDSLVSDRKGNRFHEIITACVVVSWALLLAQLAVAADSQSADVGIEESAISVSAEIGSQISLYEEQIAALESESGPFHFTLLEPLQGLAASLIELEDYAATQRILNRRLQLLHILDGPNSLNQIPLITELIRNDVRLQDWQSVTDRFNYIRLLHIRNPETGTDDRLRAMNELSAWLSTYMFVDQPENRHDHLELIRRLHWEMASLSEVQFGDDTRSRISWLYRYAIGQHRQFAFYWSEFSNALSPNKSSYRREYLGPVELLREGLNVVNHILDIVQTMGDPQAEAMAMVYVADFQMLLRQGSAKRMYRSAEEKFIEAGIEQQQIEDFFARAVVLPLPQFHLTLDAALSQQDAAGYMLKPGVEGEPGAEQERVALHLGEFIAWNRLAPTARFPALPEPTSATIMRLESLQVQFSIDSRGKSRDAKSDKDSSHSALIKSVAQNAVRAMQFRPRFAQRGGQRVGDVTMNYSFPSLP